MFFNEAGHTLLSGSLEFLFFAWYSELSRANERINLLSYLIRACERFSIDWRTTKIKLTTTANQRKGKYLQEPIRTQRKTTEMSKARENAGDQVVIGFLVLHLIGWKRGASFLDQSQSDVNQTPSNSRVFSTFIENCCNYFALQSLRGRGKFMELVWWRWRHASINGKGKQWFFFLFFLFSQSCSRWSLMNWELYHFWRWE